ncbi:hypothetical protein F2Q69_00001566 [Brassica cretica]|uniref:Pre-mRNA-processing factor 19 n=1 Tax=Brassica cretica TaxID=69181 RepID=A0A8S9NUE6_BRACR|nr:hypothetical protein F2Q69_00001566 [Brassica cretica]
MGGLHCDLLFHTVSGEVPEEPVVSTKSGLEHCIQLASLDCLERSRILQCRSLPEAQKATGTANIQTAAEDGVKFWDLRKLRNFKSFLSADANSAMQLLYSVPGRSALVVLLIEKSPCKATCVKFGSDARYIAVGSMDSNLRIFGIPSDERANNE